MTTPLSTSPTLEFIPASERPLCLRDETTAAPKGKESQIEGYVMKETFRFLYLEDPERGEQIRADDSEMSKQTIEQLAAGESLRTPRDNIEAPGQLRLLRCHVDGKLTHLLQEFIPDVAVAHGLSYTSWHALRFPDDSAAFSPLEGEAWDVYLHALWVEETHPAPTLAPDDELLCRAAVDNQENLIAAILAAQPCIEVTPGMEKSIQQTALGIAMENTGRFGCGPGLMSGCHRRFRDDDFHLAESGETWVPRAERIADRLVAAGAIDYSPIFAACRAGETEKVEAMLKAGFPPNFSIYGHTTALLEAVQPGHEDLCDLLLCYGANPNQPRPFTTSLIDGGMIYPLTVATEHPAILIRLLQAGADATIQCDDRDATPVIIAATFPTQENAEEIFRLVDFSSIRGKYHRSGVFYLTAKDLPHCRYVIPFELLDARDDTGMTPLLHAMITQGSRKAQMLIAMGADPTLPGMAWETDANDDSLTLNGERIRSQHLTPIQLALIQGNWEMVEYLLDNGAPATRHTQVIRLPKALGDEAYEAISQKLEAYFETTPPAHTVKSNGDDYGGLHKNFSELEAKLGMLVMNDAHAASHFPEWIESFDLLTWAEEHQLHPALLAPLRTGRKLGKSEWLHYAGQTLVKLEQITQTLNEGSDDENDGIDARDMLNALDHAEDAWSNARLRITGTAKKPLTLSSEAYERASGDFDGGTARARRAAATTGEVSFEDFLDCFKAAMEPGSTMDTGKLIQAVRAITSRLKKRCAYLNKKI